MAQNLVDFSSDPSGDQLLDDLLTDMRSNLHTQHSGLSRPSYVAAGMAWLDTTTDPWIWNVFDGTSDIAVGTFNITAHTFTPNGGVLNNLSASTDPTIGDDSADGYSVGSLWINTTEDTVYLCVDASVGAAVWQKVFTGTAGANNILINGLFSVNQRAVTSIADDTYHLDRWYALNQTAAQTVAQQTDQENGQPYNLRMTQPQASAQRIGVAQIVEGKNCKHLRGQSAFLSARTRCSLSQPIRYAILEWTGTEDAVTSDVVNDWTSGTFTAGNFFNSTTLNVLATGSVTPTANTWEDIGGAATVGASANNLIVMFWSEGTLAQNATLDLGKAQLEAGTVKSSFQYRPYGEELALCQRYCYVHQSIDASGQLFTLGQCSSTTAAYWLLNLPVKPRINFTGISVSSAGHFGTTNTSLSLQTLTALTFNSCRDGRLFLQGTVASGLTAGSATFLGSTSASGRIETTGAEL